MHCTPESRRQRKESLSCFGSRFSPLGRGGGRHHTQRELIRSRRLPGRALPKHRRVPFPDHQVLHGCPWEVHILAGGEAGGQQAAEAQQHCGQPLVGATSALDQEHHVHACAKAALRLSALAPPRAPKAGGRASRQAGSSLLPRCPGKPCVRLASSLFAPPALPCLASAFAARVRSVSSLGCLAHHLARRETRWRMSQPEKRRRQRRQRQQRQQQTDPRL